MFFYYFEGRKESISRKRSAEKELAVPISNSSRRVGKRGQRAVKKIATARMAVRDGEENGKEKEADKAEKEGKEAAEEDGNEEHEEEQEISESYREGLFPNAQHMICVCA